MAYYKLFVPAAAVGSNKVYFDLFHEASSRYLIDVVSLLPVVNTASAVTGTLGVELFLTRTSAVGTGGTAALRESADLTKPTFCSVQGRSSPMPREVSARSLPTGGGTPSSVLSYRCIFTEETNAGTYMPAIDMARGLYPDLPGISVSPGSGLRVVQGSVASVGSIAFDLILRVED